MCNIYVRRRSGMAHCSDSRTTQVKKGNLMTGYISLGIAKGGGHLVVEMAQFSMMILGF